MNSRIAFLCCAALAAQLVWTPPMLAQTNAEPPAAPPTAAAPAAAATEPNQDKSEVVTLSEFDVKATGDTYIASEDLSGSRLAGKIVDEPFDIQSVTSQFINDFALTGGAGDEALGFTAGYARLETPSYQGGMSNNGTIGGFPSTSSATLQGVFWDGIAHYGYVPDVAMIDGVELIKGPQSTLYGDAEPGGMINYIMRRPSLTPEYDLSLTTGTYDYYRFVADASGPVISDKLYYLATVTSTRTEENQDYTYYWNRVAYTRLLYKPTTSTNLLVSFEELQTTGDPSTEAPLPKLIVGATQSASNPFAATGGVAVGFDSAQFPYFNFYGPRPQIDRNFIGLDAQWQQQLNDNWSFQVTGDRYTKTYMGNFWTTANYFGVTGRYGQTQPEVEYETIQLASFLSDVVGHIQTGPIKHTLQFGFDASEQDFREDAYELATSAEITSLIPLTEQYEDPSSPDWSPFNYGLITPGQDQLGPDGKQITRLLRYVSTPTEFASERMFFWNDRLILMGNVSHDVIYENITDLAALTHGVLDTNANTYAVGGNFKVFNNDSLVLFGNKSTGFDADAGVDQGDGSIEQPERSKGYEAGIKSALLNEKLDFTLCWFENTKYDVSLANPAYLNPGAGIPEYLGSGTDYIHGFTLDASSHVSDAVSLLWDVGYMPSTLAAAPSTPTDVGRTLQNVPVWEYGFAVRYQFLNGWPKGVTIGVSTNYQSAILGTYATATTYQLVEPSTVYWNAFAHYGWKTGRVQHQVGVNFKNIFNRYFLDYAGTPMPQATINFTYSLKL